MSSSAASSGQASGEACLSPLEPESKRVRRAMGRAVAAGLHEHKLLGRSIVVADADGQHRAPPEEIVVPVIPDDEPGA